MRVPLALLAEYAVVKSDGSFYVIAGGFDTVQFASYPQTLDRLSLAVKVSLDVGERTRPNLITLQFHGPDGTSFAPPTDVAIAPNAGSTLPPIFNFVYNLTAVRLERQGMYEVRVLSGAEEKAATSFQARTVEGRAASTEARASLYGDAFRAYRVGDTATAERLFRALVDENPSWALARNALGFIMLAKGDGAAALEHFQTAQQLGAGIPDMLDVNVACCHYLLGHWQRALDDFEYALRTHTMSSPPIFLAAINEDGVVPVELATAGDYVALVALNAGWSAIRLRQIDAAQRHLRNCRASIDDEGAPLELSDSLQQAEAALNQLEMDRD